MTRMMLVVSDIGLANNCNVLRLADYEHIIDQFDLNAWIRDDIRHISRGTFDCVSFVLIIICSLDMCC